MKYLRMLFSAFKDWLSNDMGYYAAAFSFYAPLALIPLVSLSIVVSGFFYGPAFVKGIFLSWGTILGDDLLALVNVAIQNLDIESKSYRLPTLAIVFFSGMSFFALNVLGVGFCHLWKVSTTGFASFLSRSWRSLMFIVILQTYFFVVIGLHGVATMFKTGLGQVLASSVLSLSVPLMFFLLFKFLVKHGPSWRGCVAGSLVSGVLFLFAKSLVDLYLVANPILSIFGATGLTLVLLIWVYVLASIIFLGASVAGSYDRMGIIKSK